jgi:transposase
LLAAASQASSGDAPAGPSAEALQSWLTALPEAEKTDLLWQAFQQEGSPFALELLRRFQGQQGPLKRPAANTPRRTVSQLRKAGKEAEERRKSEAAQKKAAARKKELQKVAERESELWKEIDQHIQTQKAKGYEEAVRLLKDLVDMGKSAGREEEMVNRIRKLREQLSKKSALMKRFNAAGLPK